MALPVSILTPASVYFDGAVIQCLVAIKENHHCSIKIIAKNARRCALIELPELVWHWCAG